MKSFASILLAIGALACVGALRAQDAPDAPTAMPAPPENGELPPPPPPEAEEESETADDDAQAHATGDGAQTPNAPVEYRGGTPPAPAPDGEPAEAPEENTHAPAANGAPAAEATPLSEPTLVREATPEETLVSDSPFLSPMYQMRRLNPVRPNAPTGSVEFRGAVKLGGEWQFSLYDARQKRGFWVRMNDADSPYVVTRYDETTNAIALETNGVAVEIPLSRPNDAPLAIATSPGASQPIGNAAPKAAATAANAAKTGANAKAAANGKNADARTAKAARTTGNVQVGGAPAGGKAQTNATVTAPTTQTQTANPASNVGRRRRIVAPN